VSKEASCSFSSRGEKNISLWVPEEGESRTVCKPSCFCSWQTARDSLHVVITAELEKMISLFLKIYRTTCERDGIRTQAMSIWSALIYLCDDCFFTVFQVVYHRALFPLLLSLQILIFLFSPSVYFATQTCI